MAFNLEEKSVRTGDPVGPADGTDRIGRFEAAYSEEKEFTV